MNLEPIGVLFIDKTTKKRVFYTFKEPSKQPVEPGKITKQPTPEEVEIEKEHKKDYSLSGILKRHHVKDLPKNPLSK